MLSGKQKEHIKILSDQYKKLLNKKIELLLFDAEIAENVYNSNAIENSTLTLVETEDILLNIEFSKKLNIREVFEAKNTTFVNQYVMQSSKKTEITEEFILLLHKMLLGNIDEPIAGRFREGKENVKVFNHVAPRPSEIPSLIEALIEDYLQDTESHFLEKIARFHCKLENIHPFNDGNGRLGRALINFSLIKLGLPPIIVFNSEKHTYYKALREFDTLKSADKFEKILFLQLSESLNKRLAYYGSGETITLAEFARINSLGIHNLINKARRQTIGAFRERGVWKILHERNQ